MPAKRSPASAGPNLLYAVKQVELAVRAHLDEALRPFGVTTIQYTALTVLEDRDDITSAALARRSFVTAQTMGDIVMVLERRGFIVRHPDPAHARRLTIALTDRGRQLLDEVREDVRLIELKMTKGFSDKQCEDLRRLLRTCLANLAPPKTQDRSDADRPSVPRTAAPEADVVRMSRRTR
jgi:DNA-binding MarR family transcriptional regulator